MTPRDESRTRLLGARRDPDDIRREFWDDLDSGWMMTLEFVAATVVWGGIGLLLDAWLDTDRCSWSSASSWASALGLWILWARSTGKLQRPPPPPPRVPRVPRVRSLRDGS